MMKTSFPVSVTRDRRTGVKVSHKYVVGHRLVQSSPVRIPTLCCSSVVSIPTEG